MSTEPNDQLRQARKDKGWTQPQLAEMVGVSGSTVQRWENNGQFPTFYARRKLRNLFGMTDEQLGFVMGEAKGQEKDLQTPSEEKPSAAFLANAETFSSIETLQDASPLLPPTSPPPRREEQHEEKNAPQATLEQQTLSPITLPSDTTPHAPFSSSSTDTSTVALSFVPFSRDEQQTQEKTGAPHIPLPSSSPSLSVHRFPQWLKLLLAFLTFIVVLSSGAVLWLKRSSPNVLPHVLVSTTDCDQLLTQSQQLTNTTSSDSNDELLQIQQRLQSCTLPTGVWDSNANGYQGAFFLQLDYRGSLQGTFQSLNLQNGHWDSKNKQIIFSRSSANGIEVQTFTGNLIRSTTGYKLHGTFTDTLSNAQSYNWSATTSHETNSILALQKK